ncbi:MAG: hypothetical protein HY341_01545 [Candidatus Kerfeldbacteria bacterium]|nr:hypothetical protein [Candidatus Kerfeldbacteria bacterium]
MALVKKQVSIQRLILLVVVVVIVIGVIVFILVGGTGGDQTTPTANLTDRAIEQPLPSTLGESLFDDPRYTELEPHGDLPVHIGDVGRDNPFILPAR